MSVRGVPPEQTQPRAEDLVGPDEVIERLKALESTGRARFGVAGCSREGRAIPYVILSTPGGVLGLDRTRTEIHELSTPQVRHETLDHVSVDARRTPSGLEFRVPILLTGGSFAFEASLTESLLQVAEHLATSNDLTTERVLESEVVIVMPMTNPDGTVRALDEWHRAPLSCGWSGGGNSYGLLQNRDFLNLAQPETQAIARMWRDWCPIVHYDPQEDIVMLGVTRSELCWCPPYRAGTYPGALPSVTDKWVRHLGMQIANRWQKAGYRPLYDPTGKEGFLPVIGELGARCAVVAMFRDVIGIETESARTPGTQTWEDRNRQKFLAAMTILETVHMQRGEVLSEMLAVRNAVNTQDARAYVVPRKQRDRGLLRALLRVLLRHDVRVYVTASPFPAYVVPLSQPRPYLVQFLLSDWPGFAPECLAPEYGIRIARISDLDIADQNTLRAAPLQAVVEEDAEGCVVHSRGFTEPSKAEVFTLSPTATHVRLVARLADGGSVERTTRAFATRQSELPAGTFVLAGMSEETIRRAAWGLDRIPLEVDLRRHEVRPSVETTRVKLPRVAVYAGQGCKYDYEEYLGAIRFGLRYLEIGYVEIGDRDFQRHGCLDDVDVLVIPDGAAKEIADGMLAAPTYSTLPPWSPPEDSAGIGEAGMHLIRHFVQRGGRYVGFGLGGGALAGEGWLELIDIHVVAGPSIKAGAVALKKCDPDSPVFYGCFADLDSREAATAGAMWTHFAPIPSWYSKPGDLASGDALIFAAGPGVKTLAEIGDSGLPAVLCAQYGQGEVLVFAVTPVYRGFWLSSALLLANTILTPAGFVDAQGSCAE